jgi:hypothetical protein
MGRFYGLLFLLSVVICRPAWSQETDCEEAITRATEEFNAGHLYNISGILSECLKSFTREQKQRAYLLLAQTYLLLDDPIGAEKSYLEILRANPEFVADEKIHPIDVVYLSKRYTATPKFSLFVGGGSNVSPVRVIYDLNIMDPQKKKYSFRPGYHFGIGGEYSFDDHIRLRLELNYLHTAYKAQAIDYSGRDTKELIDRQTWLNLPAYVCYADKIGPYRPYVYAGYSLSSLFGDNASISMTKVTTETDPQDPASKEQRETFGVESPDFNFKKRRTELNQSLIFGGGVKYKMGLDFLFVDVRYSAGLKLIGKPEYSFGDYSHDQVSDQWVSSFSPGSEYAHRDDYLRLDNLALTIGYVHPLYKPRELKRARTKGVLRKMQRSQ